MRPGLRLEHREVQVVKVLRPVEGIHRYRRRSERQVPVSNDADDFEECLRERRTVVGQVVIAAAALRCALQSIRLAVRSEADRMRRDKLIAGEAAC